MTAALAAILAFAVLAFGSTERWALAILQIAIFALGIAQRHRLRFPPVLWPLAGMAGWGLVQLGLGTTVYRFATWNAVVWWTAWWILGATAAGILDDPESRRKLLAGIKYGAGILAIEAILQHYTSPGGRIYWLFPTRTERSLGPFVNPDHYAAFAELALPLALAGRGPMDLVISGALYASVICGGSRAGAIVATAEILVIPLFVHGRKGLRLVAVAALAAAIGGGQLLWTRFQLADPFRYRREIAQSAWAMIADRPFAGFGLGAFQTVYPAYARFDIGQIVDHAHNDWLEWTAEGGVVVAALLAAMAWISLRGARRFPHLWGLYAVGVHSMVDFPLQIPGLTALAIVLLATHDVSLRNWREIASPGSSQRRP
jgi:hypothetical protein